MKVLVTYYSETGNTEKIANKIYNTLQEEKEIIHFNELDPNSLVNYDLIFLGSCVHALSVPKKVKKVMRNFPDDLDSKIAVFITHGVPDKNFYENCFKSIKKYCDKKNLEVIGEFHCLGKHANLELVEKLFPNKLEESKKSDSHPDENDLNKIEEFANNMIKKF
ncbi:MAG: hypothetical protein EU548_04150 [Promethearchaeota archaeon]|nr:MAG: hypothetical protein EU548_04150 [Candidatus Lokiarchaeota archaeon]